MRLHDTDGNPRSVIDLIGEFQTRWEWAGELAFAAGWEAVDYQRFFDALNVMWDDWRTLRPLLEEALRNRRPVEVAP